MRRVRQVVTAAAVTTAGGLLALSAVGAWVTHGGRAEAKVSFDDGGLVTEASTGAAGLYPGKVGAGQVVVTNRTAVAAKVTSISPAASADDGECPVAVVTSAGRDDPAGLVQVDGSTVTVPSGAMATYVVEIAMAANAPAACAGKSFPLVVEIAGSGA